MFNVLGCMSRPHHNLSMVIKQFQILGQSSENWNIPTTNWILSNSPDISIKCLRQNQIKKQDNLCIDENHHLDDENDFFYFSYLRIKLKISKSETLFVSFPKMSPKLNKTARIQDEVPILFYSSLWMLDASLNSVILNSPLSRDAIWSLYTFTLSQKLIRKWSK